KQIVKKVLPWVLGLGAAGAAVVAAPLVIAGVGFGAGGIAAGSLAASMMSSAATTGNVLIFKLYVMHFNVASTLSCVLNNELCGFPPPPSHPLSP
ncbi:unnamed protein product, partial [Candidula unifasciata]